jgi:hypothetical protein
MECSARARGRHCPTAPCKPFGTSTPLRAPRGPRQNRPPVSLAARARSGVQWGEKGPAPYGTKLRQNRSPPPDRNTRQIPDRESCSEGTQNHHAMGASTPQAKPSLNLASSVRSGPRRALGSLLKSIYRNFAEWDCGHEAHSDGRSRYRQGPEPSGCCARDRVVKHPALLPSQPPHHPDDSDHRPNYFARRHRSCSRSAGWLP